jgi:hypothetical protein
MIKPANFILNHLLNWKMRFLRCLSKVRLQVGLPRANSMIRANNMLCWLRNEVYLHWGLSQGPPVQCSSIELMMSHLLSHSKNMVEFRYMPSPSQRLTPDRLTIYTNKQQTKYRGWQIMQGERWKIVTVFLLSANLMKWNAFTRIGTGDLQFQSPMLYHWAKETCPTSWASRNVVAFRYNDIARLAFRLPSIE